MDPSNLIIAIMILSQTIVGILGNFSLLSHYLTLYYHECSLKTTDVILKHLTMANILIVLSKGVPHTMTAFAMKLFINEMGCRFTLYVERVGRSMSIDSTCILSVFQGVAISPRDSCWKDLKVRAPKYIAFFMSLFWILYTMVNSFFPIYILSRNLKGENMTEKRGYGYCSTEGGDAVMDSLYAALVVFPEVLLSVLIVWSSGSMVVILYRHKQRVQHIRSTSVSSRASPESRATRTTLTLVSTFLTFYTLSSILNACVALLRRPSPWLRNTNSIISMCFPTFGPFILRSYAPTLSRLCFVCIRNKKSPSVMINM